jgi:3-phosphoshikimate 1-carboxyvinyltransferase
MKKFGIAYVRKDNSISLNNAARTYINPEEYQIEPDYSAACYFWALGALSSESIGVKVSSDNSSQGDFNFLKILKEMGAEINYEEGLISVKKSTLKGVRCSMKEMPDQVPTLAVLALFADTPTEIYDIDYLKYKESDRISSLCIELSKLGVQIYYSDGALTVHPLVSAPQKATLHTFQDHRLVMAFSVLTSMFPQITITDKQCVAKSFPDFFTELDKLKPLSQ